MPAIVSEDQHPPSKVTEALNRTFGLPSARGDQTRFAYFAVLDRFLFKSVASIGIV